MIGYNSKNKKRDTLPLQYSVRSLILSIKSILWYSMYCYGSGDGVFFILVDEEREREVYVWV